MEREFKIGDWVEFIDDVHLVVNLADYETGDKDLLLFRDGEAEWVNASECEPLPDCDGWGWVKVQPTPQYRPFKNEVEFTPFRNDWITRVDCNGKQTNGYWRVIGVDDFGVWSECDKVSYADLLAKYAFHWGFNNGEPETAPCGVLEIVHSGQR
jgi:hypothetical protein